MGKASTDKETKWMIKDGVRKLYKNEQKKILGGWTIFYIVAVQNHQIKKIDLTSGAVYSYLLIFIIYLSFSSVLLVIR